MKLPRRTALLIGLALWFSPSAWAHDPYEITSVAYLHSNRIELFVEMEFPTGMTLAGQKPVRDMVVQTQFESALPRLRELAGSFYDLTAGNNVVLPLVTNVELGVEDHIRFRVEFAPTPDRPLRFVARGLGVESGQNPYGTSLTVLDMVNQKVLGQATLFAATPTAEFPPRMAEPTEVAATPIISKTTVPVTNIASPSQPASTPVTNPAPTARMPIWLLAIIVLCAGSFIVFAFLHRRS